MMKSQLLPFLVVFSVLTPSLASSQNAQVGNCHTLESSGNFVGPDETIVNGMVCKIVKAQPPQQPIIAPQSATPTPSGKTPPTSVQGVEITNARIIEMSKLGLDDEIIIARIKHGTCHFQLGDTDLLDLKNTGVSAKVIAAMLDAVPFTPTGVTPVPETDEESRSASQSVATPQNGPSPQKPQGADLQECIKHKSPQCRQTVASVIEAGLRQNHPDVEASAEDKNSETLALTSVTLFESKEKRLNWKTFTLGEQGRIYYCNLGFGRVVLRKYKDSASSDQDEGNLDCSSIKRPDPNLVSEANRHVKINHSNAQQTTWYQPTNVHSYNEGGYHIEVYPYLAKNDDGRVGMRLTGFVVGSDWVQVNQLKAVIDGSSVTIQIDPRAEIDHKVLENRYAIPNLRVQTQEKIDFENRNEFIQRVARGKDVYFSFEGNTRRVEIHMKPSDIQNFVWVVALYENESIGVL